MTVDATIAFTYDDQFWTHVFQIEADCTILQLKEKMLEPKEPGKMPGTRQDVDAFELRLKGQRVSDSEEICQAHTFDFVFLGIQEGAKRAREDEEDWRRRDEERKKAETTKAKTTKKAKSESPTRKAAAPKPVGPPKLVQVVVKHATEECWPLTVDLMSNCNVGDLRREIMELLCEPNPQQVNILKIERESVAGCDDGEIIGMPREFLCMGRSLNLPTGPMEIVVTIDAELDFKTPLEIERGATVQSVKEMLAQQDPTGGTQPETFGLGISTGGGAVLAIPDWTQLRDKHKELQVTEPYKEPEVVREPVGTVPVEKVPAVPIWKVVGGSQQGGIVCRWGEDTKSPQLERLGSGVVVEEMELIGERLHFKKISGWEGSGPDEGWVSLTYGGKELVTRFYEMNLESFTLDRAIALQLQLKAGFESEECQKQLAELNAEIPKRSGGKYVVRKNNILLGFQVGPLSRCGFEGSAKGVQHMMAAFGWHAGSEITQALGNEISRIIG